MKRNMTAVITDGGSDLLTLLERSGARMKVIKTCDLLDCGLDDYNALMILGGTGEKPFFLQQREHMAVRRFAESGRKVFVEYSYNMTNIMFSGMASTRFERPVFVSDTVEIPGLELGDLLDEQSNNRLSLWRATYDGLPILQYVKNPEGFYKTEIKPSDLENKSDAALWFEEPNVLVCSFRIVNFIKACFAPRAKWQALIGYIVNWATGTTPNFGAMREFYDASHRFDPYDESKSFEEQLDACVKAGIDWFYDADMLIKRYGGYYGAKEGLTARVLACGAHEVAVGERHDCTGEVSAMYYMDYLLNGDGLSKSIADGLLRSLGDLKYDYENAYKGMTGNIHNIYADDNARGLLFTILIRALYGGEREHLGLCEDALDFLVRTTGSDGLRVVRTEMNKPDTDIINGMNLESREEDGFTKWAWGFFEKDINALKNEPGDVPSAHYNAFYLGCLMLAYKLIGKEEYKTVGVKGFESMMEKYPFTAREHSETQEYCRLVYPLAMLYWVTGDERHKGWLYKVCGDLQRFKHPSGGYLEWDTGYTAVCAGIKDNESSVLSNNGDPIVDMLYSINWLPVGFMQAYFVTGDMYFMELWKCLAKFFISAQIKSDDKMLNGVWTRALDVNLWEVYGVPNDIGWAPWSVESGWTVGEIVTGLLMGRHAERLIECYKI